MTKNAGLQMNRPLEAVKLAGVVYPARYTGDMLVLTGAPPVLWADTLYIGWGALPGLWYVGIVSPATFTLFTTCDPGEYAHHAPLEAI